MVVGRTEIGSVERFKSDRGGIEMMLNGTIWMLGDKFKSDRGGIEIHIARAEAKDTHGFKSDRGGIEMRTRQTNRSRTIRVQIRPWRD